MVGWSPGSVNVWCLKSVELHLKKKFNHWSVTLGVFMLFCLSGQFDIFKIMLKWTQIHSYCFPIKWSSVKHILSSMMPCLYPLHYLNNSICKDAERLQNIMCQYVLYFHYLCVHIVQRTAASSLQPAFSNSAGTLCCSTVKNKVIPSWRCVVFLVNEDMA